MTAIEAGLQDLKHRHPEWEPWLAVVQEILSETTNPEWDALVPARSEAQQSKVPLLAGITLGLKTRSVRRLLEKLIRAAHQNGTPKLATLESALRRDLDFLNCLRLHCAKTASASRRLPLTWAQTRRRSTLSQLSCHSPCYMLAIAAGLHLNP